ncbi:MAG: hypothetical protein ACE37F_21985 [Nannocystaceae bacterium]|nr:hypothetical protein [bacterium]
MRTWTSLLILGALLACDSDGTASGESGIDAPTSSSDPAVSTTSGEPDASSTSTGASTGASTDPTNDPTDDSEDDGPEPPVNFDFGAVPDFGEFNDGCNAVDFLFVIDNSGSMFSAQNNLIANFPAFIDGIQATLTDVESYHVGVITTDDHNSFTPSNPPECRQLGALVTSTAGFDSSNAVCGPYTEGFNFITEQDDLSTSFECAAQVGTSGAGFELTMNAMEAAISDDLNAEGACNEGFIRDEALLVVVVITDESDGPGDSEGPPPASSTGDSMSWYESVVAAKNDTPENAAALVLTNYDGGPCPPTATWEDGVNIVDFAELFGENGFTAGICQPDYGPAFANATAVIEQACENFIPPG